MLLARIGEPHESRKRATTKQALREYRLTPAEIIYHLPDHPDLLQSFVWQKLDLAPDFPELRRFSGILEPQSRGQVSLRQGRPGEVFGKVEV